MGDLLGPPVRRDPPAVAPPRVGLLASARTPRDPDERWTQGFTYDPDFCGDGYITNAENPAAADRVLEASVTDVTWIPYIIGAGLTCTALQVRNGDWQARALRALNAIAEYRISREFWTGEEAQSEGWANGYLADVTNVDILTESGPVGLTHGLACLQQYLAETLQGRRGMIHATRQVITHWSTLNLLRREGAVIVDLFDNIIVPGAGYDGTDPNGNVADGNVWAYATGMVDVRRSAIDADQDMFAQDSIDRDLNSVEVFVEQAAVASWDRCAHGGVRLDVVTCDVGGS